MNNPIVEHTDPLKSSGGDTKPNAPKLPGGHIKLDDPTQKPHEVLGLPLGVGKAPDYEQQLLQAAWQIKAMQPQHFVDASPGVQLLMKQRFEKAEWAYKAMCAGLTEMKQVYWAQFKSQVDADAGTVKLYHADPVKQLELWATLEQAGVDVTETPFKDVKVLSMPMVDLQRAGFASYLPEEKRAQIEQGETQLRDVLSNSKPRIVEMQTGPTVVFDIEDQAGLRQELRRAGITFMNDRDVSALSLRIKTASVEKIAHYLPKPIGDALQDKMDIDRWVSHGAGWRPADAPGTGQVMRINVNDMALKERGRTLETFDRLGLRPFLSKGSKGRAWICVPMSDWMNATERLRPKSDARTAARPKPQVSTIERVDLDLDLGGPTPAV